MLAVKTANVRDHFQEWCDKIRMGETIVIPDSENQKIYMINETEYNELQKAKQNVEYLTMLDERIERLNNGEGIHKTMEELRAMENE